MKRTIAFFTTLLMLILAFTAGYAQTYDTPASAAEGDTYVRYTGNVDMTDGEASYYTQALYIGDANQDIGVLQLSIPDSTGTEDVNVFVEFSQDRLNWNAISTAVLDQATAGTSYDTLSTVDGSALIEFKGSTWMRLHFDGQAGNPANTLTWSAYLPKNSGAPPRGNANVLNRRS